MDFGEDVFAGYARCDPAFGMNQRDRDGVDSKALRVAQLAGYRIGPAQIGLVAAQYRASVDRDQIPGFQRYRTGRTTQGAAAKVVAEFTNGFASADHGGLMKQGKQLDFRQARFKPRFDRRVPGFRGFDSPHQQGNLVSSLVASHAQNGGVQIEAGPFENAAADNAVAGDALDPLEPRNNQSLDSRREVVLLRTQNIGAISQRFVCRRLC